MTESHRSESVFESFIKCVKNRCLDPIHVAHGQYVQIHILNEDPENFFGLVHDTPFSDSPLDIRKRSIEKKDDHYVFEAVDTDTGNDWRFEVRFEKSEIMERIMAKASE